ncbi:hypothetical protein NEHOM01_1947 [Nematocida homosporus]|uniref:uncharacterized protein n=1 Tax=Nematocida homosporus TaxID=1912981 RepID=UPI002220CD95|nr:uncharacterized protein NEHOM01_1947 [Nematocida homosporus]KAI5187121.1 hypothetical protein NEHOM01_1947 [Nematocida homosporus]
MEISKETDNHLYMSIEPEEAEIESNPFIGNKRESDSDEDSVAEIQSETQQDNSAPSHIYVHATRTVVKNWPDLEDESDTDIEVPPSQRVHWYSTISRFLLGTLYSSMLTDITAWLVYVNILIRPKDYLLTYFPYGAARIAQLHEVFPVLPIIGDYWPHLRHIFVLVNMAFFSSMLFASPFWLPSKMKLVCSSRHFYGLLFTATWCGYAIISAGVLSYLQHAYFKNPTTIHFVLAIISTTTVSAIIVLFRKKALMTLPWPKINMYIGWPILGISTLLVYIGLASCILMTSWLQLPLNDHISTKATINTNRIVH